MLHPIYTTTGEHAAFFENGYIFNPGGEWIGFVDMQTAALYSIRGEYVGHMSRDGRLLRKRAQDHTPGRRTPPPKPPKPQLPATVPLAPLFAELGYDTIDILSEMPELLPTADAGELRPDMD